MLIHDNAGTNGPRATSKYGKARRKSEPAPKPGVDVVDAGGHPAVKVDTSITGVGGHDTGRDSAGREAAADGGVRRALLSVATKSRRRDRCKTDYIPPYSFGPINHSVGTFEGTTIERNDRIVIGPDDIELTRVTLCNYDWGEKSLHKQRTSLALSILLEMTGDIERASGMMTRFREEFVERLVDRSWTLEVNDIRSWIETTEEADYRVRKTKRLALGDGRTASHIA